MFQGSKNCQEKQRKNSTSIEDRRCLECSRHFSTSAALISHVKTHKSLDLALSDSSSPHSQTLPATSASSPLVPTPRSEPAAPSVIDASLLYPMAQDVAAASMLAPSPPEPALLATRADTSGSAASLTCDLCNTTLKSKAALIKHRVFIFQFFLILIHHLLIRIVQSARNWLRLLLHP